ncbi:MAG: DUF4160 domain-containing protein [Ruminococcus sp.]|jgi:hypothetical protein|nr:DUF4160 domain-containing protein [Ruminococcus sp.]
MPAISTFYGIIIRMHNRDKELHNTPHFSANYGDNNAVYGFDGEVISGSLPLKQHTLVVAWAALHDEDLAANWCIMEGGEDPFSIPPDYLITTFRQVR